jgi:hypothetical protein
MTPFAIAVSVVLLSAAPAPHMMPVISCIEYSRCAREARFGDL